MNLQGIDHCRGLTTGVRKRLLSARCGGSFHFNQKQRAEGFPAAIPEIRNENMKTILIKSLVACLGTLPYVKASESLPVSFLPTTGNLNPYFGSAPFGRLRFPGSRGGAYVMPYRGAGVYTFIVEARSGVYNWGYDPAETPTGLVEPAVAPAYLCVTSNNLTTTVPINFFNTYTKVAELASAMVESEKEPENWDIFLTRIAYRLPDSAPRTNFYHAFYYNKWLDLASHLPLFSTLGWGSIVDLEPNVHPIPHRVRLTFKFRVTAATANPSWKHFVLKDWFTGGAVGDGSANGGDIFEEGSGGNITVSSVMFEPDAPALSGALTVPRLLEGFKGNIKVNFTTDGK